MTARAILPPGPAILDREDLALLVDEFDREKERRRRGWREGVRRKYWTAAEAHELAERRELPQSWRLDEIREKELREVTWEDLHDLAEVDTEESLRKWADIKQAAAFEFEYRAGTAASGGQGSLPMDRAVYFHLVDSLRQEWRPTGASEEVLIRSLAQAATMAETWLRVCSMQVHSYCETTEKDLIEDGSWKGPRVRDVEAQDQAMTMYDRWNRIFLRTLRALRDLRRYQVVVNAPGGQVNIAAPGGQQVNVQE